MHPHRVPPLRSRRTRGYTAVEVLVALTLFAVGTAGVLSLQRAALVGASDARKADVASTIASEWLERLRQDSTAWSLPTATNPLAPSNHATATRYLGVVQAGPVGTPDAGAETSWAVAPIPATVAQRDLIGSPAYDMVGQQLLASTVATDAMFCVQYRLQWVVLDQLMRAEVRVLYTRDGARVPCVQGTNFTSASAAAFHSVNMTTTLRQP